MKRITWWPQLWLGLTFNWAVLVAYAIKTGELNLPVMILYAGLIFWTVGYDTIYACQDIEDDAMIGVKSTARRFGKRVKVLVSLFYLAFVVLTFVALFLEPFGNISIVEFLFLDQGQMQLFYPLSFVFITLPANLIVASIVWQFKPSNSPRYLTLFKRNFWVGVSLALGILSWYSVLGFIAVYLLD